MIKKTIEELPEVLKKHICTMKKASLDNSRTKSMSDSLLKVINFDKIPKEYLKGKGWPNMPASNDVLYISVDGKWYFIEFKNGSVDKSELYRKIYDSLIMLIELRIIPDFEFARKNMHYILVYNSEKYPSIPKSENRSKNYSYFLERAGMEEKLFDIDKFEKFLFKESHTYTEELFDKKFIKIVEKQEEMAVV